MADDRPYEIYHPDGGGPAPGETRFWTFGDTARALRAWRRPGWTFRRRRLKGMSARLNAMLAERGLARWRTWYVARRFLNGWMVNDSPGEDGMQLLGANYAQAVDMIRSGSLERLDREAPAITKKPGPETGDTHEIPDRAGMQ